MVLSENPKKPIEITRQRCLYKPRMGTKDQYQIDKRNDVQQKRPKATYGYNHKQRETGTSDKPQ